MPLEYQVLKCVQCNAFQAKQVTKQQKFSCSMCGFKQTTQRVFAISSSAKDIRLHVQKLNMARGVRELEQQAELDAALDRHEQGDDIFADDNNTCHQQQTQQQHRHANQPTATWNQYAEEAEKEEQEHAMAYGDDGQDGGNFVTAVADQKGKVRGKMKGAGAPERSAGRKFRRSQQQQQQEAEAQEIAIQVNSASHAQQGFHRKPGYGGDHKDDRPPWRSSLTQTQSGVTKAGSSIASFQAVTGSGWQPQKKPCTEPRSQAAHAEHGVQHQTRAPGFEYQHMHRHEYPENFNEQPGIAPRHGFQSQNLPPLQNNLQYQQQQQHASHTFTRTRPGDTDPRHHDKGHVDPYSDNRMPSKPCQAQAAVPFVDSKWSTFAADEDGHDDLQGDDHGDEPCFVTAW